MTSDYPVKRRKKLIEVAIPLEAIATESSHRKKKSPKGFPTTMHKWWSPKPISTAKAIIFCQLVDDPSALPEVFPTKECQDAERRRLFSIVEALSLWENHNNSRVRHKACLEITKSWERACDDNKRHPRASIIFNPLNPPFGLDPFAGSGAIPSSFQWLGLETIASDINPVAALINKCLCEYPSQTSKNTWVAKSYFDQKELLPVESNASLARLVETAGRHILSKAKAELSQFFHSPESDTGGAKGVMPTAWIWVRTVPSPNPAFSSSIIPLSASFVLSNKPGKEVYAVPSFANGSLSFEIRSGKGPEYDAARKGTSASKKATFICPLSGDVVSYKYIRQMGLEGRMGVAPVAAVMPAKRGRRFAKVKPTDIPPIDNSNNLWRPTIEFPNNPRETLESLPTMRENSHVIAGVDRLYGHQAVRFW